jgi:hypothetical protein
VSAFGSVRHAYLHAVEPLPNEASTLRFPHQTRHRRAAASASRQTSLAAAILSLSVLADSGVEHYRGSFHNRAMVAPLGAAALSTLASVADAVDGRPGRHPARQGAYALAALVGAIGLGFHAYNVTKRPGRLSWHNLFYGAPVGAPAALVLAGLFGGLAGKIRDGGRSVAGAPPAGWLAALSTVGLAGSVGEAGLLHFRGAFQNPAMFLPVAAPPVATALLAAAAIQPRRPVSRFARWGLGLTSALGFVGVGFHAFGIHRAMGGWRNWRQNLIDGPPMPAPPSFTGLALAGLAALPLLQDNSDG